MDIEDIETIDLQESDEWEGDVILKITTEDGTVLRVALPDDAFVATDSEHADDIYGLNCVFTGHYT